MKVAVVILNWNGAHYMEQFLPVLQKHTPASLATIIVADNGSTDNSISLLKEKFKDIRLIQFDQNYGFAGGYNRALAQIEADYYVILNSDVEVTEGWLSPMIDYLEHHPDVVACQPKVLSYNNRNYFEHAGAAGGFIDYLGYPFCRGRILSHLEEDKGQYDTISDVFWATGACLVIRAKTFHQAGGFDAAFFAHMEEIDLCWRLRNRNHRIVCIPQSKIYHVGGGTLQAEHPQKTYLNFRNNLLMLYKNLHPSELSPVLTIRFFMDYLAAFQLLITGKPKNARAVLKARIAYRKMRPRFKQKRLANLQSAINPHIPEITPKSIIVNYYLRGKRSFVDLW